MFVLAVCLKQLKDEGSDVSLRLMPRKWQSNGQNLGMTSKVSITDKHVKKIVYGNFEVKKESLLVIIQFDKPWCCTTMFKMATARLDALRVTFIGFLVRDIAFFDVGRLSQ